MKVVGLSSAYQTDLTPKIFSVVAPCSLADTHQHFRTPGASIIRVMEAAGSSQLMLYIYQLTVAGPRRQATSLSPPWEPQISFYVTLNISEKSVWMMYGRSIWLPSFSSRRVDSATFYLLSSHPRFYRSRSLSVLLLLGILSQMREKVCALFICLFFWGVHFTAFGVLEHFMNAVSVSRRHQVRVVFYLLFV